VLTSKRNEHQLESLPFPDQPIRTGPHRTCVGGEFEANSRSNRGWRYHLEVCKGCRANGWASCSKSAASRREDARLTLTAFADAQQFLDRVPHGRETSEGEVGVYRYRKVKSVGTDSFALESLLPDTGYDVHVSTLKLNDHALIRTGSDWTAAR
jgi:hypothetical protein